MGSNPNRGFPRPEVQLSPAELIEVVEELFDLDLHRILGQRADVPRFRMFLECKDQELMNRLNELHIEYCNKLRQALDMELEDDE